MVIHHYVHHYILWLLHYVMALRDGYTTNLPIYVINDTARARTYNIDYIQLEANAEGNTFRFSSNILRYCE